MKLKKQTLIYFCLILSGCTSTYWYKSGVSTQKFNQDTAYCQMMAESGTPVYSPQNKSTTAYHSGTVYGNGQTATYTGTTTTYDNTLDLSGFAIGLKKKSIYENCMISNGYVEVSESQTNPINTSVYDAGTIKTCKLPNGTSFKTAPSRCRSAGGVVH